MSPPNSTSSVRAGLHGRLNPLYGKRSPVAVSQVETDQLLDAWHAARNDLLSERNAQGYWVGELSSSALSTATAISALAIAEQHATSLSLTGQDQAAEDATDRWNMAYQADLSELICNSVRWLAAQQNEDGGWGDTDRSQSNLATTLLVLSAFRVTGVPAKFADLEPRAEQYIRAQGGVAGLKKRYGKDKTFAAPILANCALAGVVSWKQVPTLPFELAAMPRKWFHRLGMPVVSYAIPALVAIGLAKHHHRPSSNPIARTMRKFVTNWCLDLVKRMQPDSGGFLEATPLTSFVVMALASTGRADHRVVRRGVEFLLASVRSDGSWPIDTNLATWNTTLAVNALSKGTNSQRASEPVPAESNGRPHSGHRHNVDDFPLDWLLACQHTKPHPFTGAEPGGWAWTNLSGGVPDADDTSGALLALHGYWPRASASERSRIAVAVGRGVRWLLDLQNRDGGWPTFCRGWGKLRFDRSATDLSAHVLRALHAWRTTRGWWTADTDLPSRAGLTTADLDRQIDHAITAGLDYLSHQQSEDGSWNPLWFGNETRTNQTNPIFGTARVLMALSAVEGRDSSMAPAALQFLTRQQHASGGWGSDPHDSAAEVTLSVEETAVAVEALLEWREFDASICRSAESGLHWLVDAVKEEKLSEPAPIGLYFAKLWYHERLYPKSFAVSVLGAAVEQRVASKRQWGDDRASEVATAAAPA
ncbi:MAG: prenyltransferase/squalene oxidase repeat-containing protein [Planctomycetota bacterium]